MIKFGSHTTTGRLVGFGLSRENCIRLMAGQPMTVPGPALNAARHAYFGHRFEISKVGFFTEVHVYDLVGAYAWAVATGLPCFAHGEWWHCEPTSTKCLNCGHQFR